MWTALLLLVLVSKSYSQATSTAPTASWIVCEDSSPCDDITCPSNQECNVQCIGMFSCFVSEIDARYSTKLQLIVNGPDAFPHPVVDIYCPDDDIYSRSNCLLQIVGGYPTELEVDIYAVEGFNDLIIECQDTFVCLGAYINVHCLSDYSETCTVFEYPLSACNQQSICDKYPTADPTYDPTQQPTIYPSTVPTTITTLPTVNPTPPTFTPSEFPSIPPTESTAAPVPTQVPSSAPSNPTEYPTIVPTESWIVCTEVSPCYDITCPSNQECNVQCIGMFSCNVYKIDARLSTSLQIIVNGEDALEFFASIYCPNNGPYSTNNNPSCMLVFLGTERIDLIIIEIYAVEGFNDLVVDCTDSFVCDGTRLVIFCKEDYSEYCWASLYPLNTCDSSGNTFCDNYKLTVSPTTHPTSEPTLQPTMNPSKLPTFHPSNIPSNVPTIHPTYNPTLPSITPTIYPSQTPTLSPTNNPSIIPTTHPTLNPISPTFAPSKNPTISPTAITTDPTNMPSSTPTDQRVSVTTTAPTQSPTQHYPLIFICDYNDDREFILTHLSLMDYAEIMVDSILYCASLVLLHPVEYEETDHNPLASWNRGGIVDFTICNIFDIELQNDETTCLSIMNPYDSNDADYTAIGVFGIVSDEAINDYKQRIIDVMTSDSFKDYLNETMNQRLRNQTTDRRRLVQYNTFEVVEIRIMDAINGAIFTTEMDDEFDTSEDTISTTTIIVIVVVIVVLLVTVVSGVIYFKTYKSQKGEMAPGKHVRRNNDNNDKSQIEMKDIRNEGIQDILTENVNKVEHDDADIIKSINATPMGYNNDENDDKDIAKVINETYAGNNGEGDDDHIIAAINATPNDEFM